MSGGRTGPVKADSSGSAGIAGEVVDGDAGALFPQ